MSSFESFPGKVEKAQVIEAYKKLIEKGITNPYDYKETDTDAKIANDLCTKYFEQLDQSAEVDPTLKHRVNFEKTFFYLDAGFTDPDYVEEVLVEWVPEDLAEAEESDPALAQEMKEKIAHYKAILLPDLKE